MTVPTIPATRPDGAPVASIEVPRVKGGNGAPLLAAELPAGFGLYVEGPAGGPQTPQQALADLTKALDARSGDDGMADLASGFLNGLPADSRIVLRTIELKPEDGCLRGWTRRTVGLRSHRRRHRDPQRPDPSPQDRVLIGRRAPPSLTGWIRTSGPFGIVTMPLDRALAYVATEPDFWPRA